MLLPKFNYLAPQSIAEACALLAEHQEKAKVIAAGTDLLVQMKHKEVKPQYIIDLKRIPGLDYIRYDDQSGLQIGALTTIRAIETSPLVQQSFSILSQAAGLLGTVQIRNRGTIGGNLGNAAPSAETAPALMALAAKAKIVGSKKERVVALEDFFLGPGETVLQPDEMLTEIQVPNPAALSSGVYLKHTVRRMAELAIVGVGVLITWNGTGQTCGDVRIILGAVAPTPLRVERAEEVLKGQQLSGELMEKAAQIASEESRPIDDIRSAAEYRRKMVRVLVKRALEQATESLGGEPK